METWEDLPPEILITIFSLLDPSDRLNAALTCSSWKEIFLCPQIWRSMTCSFSDLPSFSISEGRSPPVFYGEKCIFFANHFGQHLRILRLAGEVFNNEERLKVWADIAQFFKCLEATECQLEELLVVNNYFYCDWEDLACHAFFNAIAHFLRSQTELIKVKLSWILPLFYGVLLIDAVSNNCSSKLKELHIRYCFDTSQPVCRSRAYKKCMREWTNLTVVSLNYCSLDADVLLALVTFSKATLRKLNVYSSHGNYRNHSISSDVWMEVHELAPDMTVAFTLYLAKLDVLQSILPAHVPLTWLKYYIQELGSAQSESCSCLNYLKDTFWKSLEYLDIFSHNGREQIDDCLIALVLACPNLISLKIMAIIKVETVDALCRLQAEQNLRLKQLHAEFLLQTNEQKNEVKTLTHRYEPIFKKGNLDFKLVPAMF